MTLAPDSKKILLGGLVACFAMQSVLVYSDEVSASGTTVILDGDALAGRRLWHRHNCQSCHQLHGFGGFLGPDLTNASPQIDDQRLRLVLTQGSGAMPGLGLSAEEIREVRAFLVKMNDTGRGQARVPPRGSDGGDVWTGTVFEPFYRALDAHLLETQASPSIRAGFALYRGSSCQSCHAPLSLSPLRAPDLSTVGGLRSDTQLHEVLEKGRPGTLMPPSGLSADERADLIAFLRWMGDHREALGRRLAGSEPSRIDWTEIPWWEYK